MQLMLLSKKEYWNINQDRKLFNKLFHELKYCDFLSVCLETILLSSIEITDFSSQLYFFLADIKSELWQLYVMWRHHCQSTRGSYLPIKIFSYKGISALYYSMIITLWSLVLYDKMLIILTIHRNVYLYS